MPPGDFRFRGRLGLPSPPCIAAGVGEGVDFGSLNCQLLENGGNGPTTRGCRLGGGDFLPPLTESTGRSVPSSQERWRWGVHTHHPHESGIDKKGEAEWRCQAGVLRGADFVGSLGLMSRRSYSCEAPGLTIPGCSLGPFLLRANSFVRPPRKPASPPGPWRLYSRHRCCRHPCPTVCRSVLRPAPAPLPRPGRADPAGSADRPLDVAAALPQPRLPAPTTRTPARTAGAAGADFSRRRSPPGTVGSRGRRRNGRARFRVAAPAEKTKSKTNTQQMKPACPQGSTLHPSRGGPGRLPPGQFLGSQTKAPESMEPERRLEEFVSNAPGSIASF